MGTIFVAGSYGVGKSTLCAALSKQLNIPTYSAGDLISFINGEKYGANKVVRNKDTNQDILATEVEKKLNQYPTILLAGHFCIFDKLNYVEELPHSVFEKIQMDCILLLEADAERIVYNLNIRDKKNYRIEQIKLLLKEERIAAESNAKQCNCRLYIHHMSFDETDVVRCSQLLREGDNTV